MAGISHMRIQWPYPGAPSLRPNRDDLLQEGILNDEDDSYFAQGPNSIAHLFQIWTSRDLTASILFSWYPHHFRGNKPRLSVWIGAQMFHAALLTSQLIGDVGARPAKISQTIATSQLHPVQIANVQMQALRRWQWLSAFVGGSLTIQGDGCTHRGNTFWHGDCCES